MANRKVIFDIEANNKADSGIKDASGDLKDLEKKTSEAGNAARSSGLRFTELNSAIQIGQQVWRAANDIYAATIQKFVNYADVVRTLRDITGESAEEMSRVVQLTDDYKISTEKLTMVQKTLAQQGKSLNIDTLAKMSDEYLKLATGEERQLYLTKNLGREGADYAGILKQGSAAIREQAGAINEYLILGDEQLQQARNLEIAQDNLNDTWSAFVMRVGPGLTERLTALVQLFLNLNEGEQGVTRSAADFINRILRGTPLVTDYAEGLMQAEDAAKRMSRANDGATTSADKAAIALSNLMGIAGSLTIAENSYKENAEKNNAEFLTLIEERSRLLGQGYSEQSQAIRDIDAKLDANSQKAEENAAAHELATNRIILSYAQQLLAADGLTKEEIDFLLKKGEEWGVYAEGTAEKAALVIAEAGKIADSINAIPTLHTININTIYTSSGNSNGLPQMGGGGGGVVTQETQASGGSGIVPPGYNNDNFLMGLSSGERYDIKPASRVGSSDKGNGGSVNNYTFVANGITDPEKLLQYFGQKIKQQGGMPQS